MAPDYDIFININSRQIVLNDIKQYKRIEKVAGYYLVAHFTLKWFYARMDVSVLFKP